MVRHTQTIRRPFADKLFSVFDHFMGLVLKGLMLKGLTYFGTTLCVIKSNEFDKGTHFLQKCRKSKTYRPHSDKPPIKFILLGVYETDLFDFHKLTKTVLIFRQSINLKLFKIEISITLTMHHLRVDLQ